MITMKHTSRGFSLLELLLVVGVGAVLILAGLSAYRLVSEGNAATQGIRQLQTLKQQVQQAYQGEAGYGTAAGADMVATLSTMRMLPPDMPVTGATLRNGFGSTTTIVTGPLVGGNASTFLITFNGVGTSACNKMGVVFSTATSSDFTNLSITPTGGGTANTAITVPTVGIVSAACGNTNVMVWTFR